jgi:hypothetical protein
LFNLSSSRQFTNEGEGGISCWTHVGPAFSNEKANELCAFYEPFNGDNKCASWVIKSGYCIGLEGGKNMLTNKENGNFTITEIEVWEIKNVENLVLKNKK